MSGTTDLTHKDVLRILQIVDQAEDVEVVVEYGGMKLRVQKGTVATGGAGSGVPNRVETQPTVAKVEQADTTPVGPSELKANTSSADDTEKMSEIPDGAVTVTAPMHGIFYRASSPTTPPFVDVGSRFGPEDTIALIEVMKLFNNVEAGVGGTVLEIRASNAEMVEEGQILFVVQPD